MKLVLRVVTVLLALSISQLSIARDQIDDAAFKQIKVVNVAPAVQQQLDKATREDRKKFEAAIYTGNLFVPQHFSGNAYDSDPENKDWETEVLPLISLDHEQWEEQYQGMFVTKTIQVGDVLSNLFAKKQAQTIRLVCPHITLISIQKNAEGTTLLYRTISIGTWVDLGGYTYDFNSEGAGDIYDIRFELDQDTSLVTKVIPVDKWYTLSYTRSIALMKSLGKYPPIVLTHEQDISPKRNEQVDKMAREFRENYQNAIKTIQESAAQYCK